MAKHKKEEADYNASIQFRPGASFGRVIERLSERWAMSRHEVIRRLSLLAAFGLSLDVYEPLAEAADAIGGLRGFEAACEHLKAFNVASTLQLPTGVAADAEEKKKLARRFLCAATGRTDTSQSTEVVEQAKEEKRTRRIELLHE